MNNEQRTHKAFTLIELLVAVAILAMVLSFAGTIFTVSIDSYRSSTANAQIMQNFRAITGQLDTDFKGLQKDAPLLIYFDQQDANDPNERHDQIMFFADGDFHSIQTYQDTGGNQRPSPNGTKIVRGNVARLYYGQTDANELARRQHILTADPCLVEWPDISDIDGSFDDDYGDYKCNELYEHDSLSLAKWKTLDSSAYQNAIISTCFSEPNIALNDPNTFHKLMCEGLASFAIQWAYWDNGDKKVYWFPSHDPADNGSVTSHFVSIGSETFGVFFNTPDLNIAGWYDPFSDPRFTGEDFAVFPKAIKFTFRLYDSRGIIKNGKVFTHIVYLEN